MGRQGPFFWRLRTRLVLLALTIIVPALGVTLWDQTSERGRARARAVEDTVRLARIAAGQQATVGGYTLTYLGSQQRQLVDHAELVAAMRFGEVTLEPARATYAGLGGQSLTHVAISTTPVADVYVVLAGANPDGSAAFRIFINPLVSWIWAGGAIIIIGVLLGNLGERAPALEAVRRRIPAAVST